MALYSDLTRPGIDRYVTIETSENSDSATTRFSVPIDFYVNPKIALLRFQCLNKLATNNNFVQTENEEFRFRKEGRDSFGFNIPGHFKTTVDVIDMKNNEVLSSVEFGRDLSSGVINYNSVKEELFKLNSKLFSVKFNESGALMIPNIKILMFPIQDFVSIPYPMRSSAAALNTTTFRVQVEASNVPFDLGETPTTFWVFHGQGLREKFQVGNLNNRDPNSGITSLMTNLNTEFQSRFGISPFSSQSITRYIDNGDGTINFTYEYNFPQNFNIFKNSNEELGAGNDLVARWLIGDVPEAIQSLETNRTFQWFFSYSKRTWKTDASQTQLRTSHLNMEASELPVQPLTTLTSDPGLVDVDNLDEGRIHWIHLQPASMIELKDNEGSIIDTSIPCFLLQRIVLEKFDYPFIFEYSTIEYHVFDFNNVKLFQSEIIDFSGKTFWQAIESLEAISTITINNREIDLLHVIDQKLYSNHKMSIFVTGISPSDDILITRLKETIDRVTQNVTTTQNLSILEISSTVQLTDEELGSIDFPSSKKHETQTWIANPDSDQSNQVGKMIRVQCSNITSSLFEGDESNDLCTFRVQEDKNIDYEPNNLVFASSAKRTFNEITIRLRDLRGDPIIPEGGFSTTLLLRDGIKRRRH